SMTNPPSNWGYARTVEGFLHTISGGQYEHLAPVQDLVRFIKQIWRYLEQTVHDLGLIYLPPAVLPFFFLNRMRLRERGWMLGIVATFLCLSGFMLAMLNPWPDRQAWWGLVKFHLLASHLMLAVWAGYGLVLLGTLVGRIQPGADRQKN